MNYDEARVLNMAAMVLGAIAVVSSVVAIGISLWAAVHGR